MQNALLWIVVYTFILAASQIILKIGVSQIGGFKIHNLNDFFALIIPILTNPMLILGVVLMGATFLAWMYILSWFKLSVVFPLTALTYVFVAIMASLVLGEKLLLINYLGILLIAGGIFCLLYK